MKIKRVCVFQHLCMVWVQNLYSFDISTNSPSKLNEKKIIIKTNFIAYNMLVKFERHVTHVYNEIKTSVAFHGRKSYKSIL